MASIVIPTRKDIARYSLEVELGGEPFALGFEWNDRAGAWFFSLATVDGVVLAAGRRVSVGMPLLFRGASPLLPRGDIEAVDTSGTGRDPGFDELGTRVRLLFLEVAGG